jgi:hypothetical protein
MKGALRPETDQAAPAGFFHHFPASRDTRLLGTGACPVAQTNLAPDHGEVTALRGRPKDPTMRPEDYCGLDAKRVFARDFAGLRPVSRRTRRRPNVSVLSCVTEHVRTCVLQGLSIDRGSPAAGYSTATVWGWSGSSRHAATTCGALMLMSARPRTAKVTKGSLRATTGRATPSRLPDGKRALGRSVVCPPPPPG